MARTALLVAAAAVLAAASAPSAAQIAVRPLSARVHDDAGLLSAAQRSALDGRLAAFEKETGHQIVVLTVPGLEGEAIESFSMRVAEAWQIGDAGRDDGAIVIVSASDRRARIEVGYGLEGVVPDALAARILRERMIPHFRKGEFGEGIIAGSEALMAAARGEVVPGLADESGGDGSDRTSIGHVVFLCAFLGGFLGGQFGRKRRVAGSLLGGGVAGALAWVLTVFVPGAIFAAIGASLLSALFSGGPSGRGLHSGPRGWRTGGYDAAHRGGFGGGFGGLGGGGFGGGGFGGGGGGFGGGGASGSW